MTRLVVVGLCLLLLFCQGLIVVKAQTGFISIDCGAETSYEDPTTGISWVPDTNYAFGGGSVATLGTNVTTSPPLQTLRYFPGSQAKHCFSLGPVNGSSRYLVRASFLYGSYDGQSVYPVFDLAVDASPWVRVSIINASTLYFNEFIAVATSTGSFTVCLIRGPTGSPFISTLELRPLQRAMYALPYMGPSFLSSTVRINFGAPTADPVRYPDDPSDRIWLSDMVYPLQGEAPMTYNISTNNSIDVFSAPDIPPQKVMQTAVVGGQGTLSYRLTLVGYPENAYAVVYLAEIQDLGPNVTREFRFQINVNNPLFNGSSLNLVRDAGGPYRAFEPGYNEVDLPEFTNFQFLQTNNSNLGPILNALEIYQILPVVSGTDASDVLILGQLTSQLPQGELAGDPCLPVPWDFLSCSSDSPARVTTINLSSRNLTGEIPAAIGGLTGLINLWLDNNDFVGQIPDLSQLSGLETLHLQNNQLSGSFPTSLEDLTNLREIFVGNNNLSGTVPLSLLERNGLLIQASGNPELCSDLTCARSSGSKEVNVAAIVGGSVGGAALIILLAAVVAFLLGQHFRKKRLEKDPLHGSKYSFQEPPSAEVPALANPGDTPPPGDGAKVFQFPELAEATSNFSEKIGSGGYGPVYLGKLKDGKEIAVKVLSASSNQGSREFFNEVNLLSRVHHRNLLTLIGYCPDIKEKMLVYEYMHKGSLRDHLYGPRAVEEPLDWLTRLSIVLDAAKGLEYLHEGCSPTIIHRDVKSSNILFNNKMVGKVADFGLSKLTSEDVVSTATSSTIRGTVGYLDPEYYVSQTLTTKSDVFSFGVVLLEIISGREPLLVKELPSPNANLVSWARGHLLNEDVESMVDPSLRGNFKRESVLKLADLAFRCASHENTSRPKMTQVVPELTEIINMETPNSSTSTENLSAPFLEGLSSLQLHTPSPSYLFDSSSIEPFQSSSLTDSFDEPIRR